MKPIASATTPCIISINLNVADLARATAFYEALGFTANPSRSGSHHTLTFGMFTLGLTVAGPDARPYPAPRAANDPWFQHFAIAVADMPRAFAVLGRLSAEPISRGGPQLLPASTGSVTAYKFRDPDGHPLELSHIPESDWLRDVAAGHVFLGVDHTALAVADRDRSIAFYKGLGFTVGGCFLNTGSEQDRLDGLDGVILDIVAMSVSAGPHLELLAYRTPAQTAVAPIAYEDIAATRTLLTGAAEAQCIADPDGHLVEIDVPMNRT